MLDWPTRSQGTTRAQSETVGVVILVGVIAIVATIVGVVVIGNVTSQASDAPLVEVNVSANATDVVLVHTGGDDLTASEVAVVLQRDGDSERYGLDTFTEVEGSDPATFSPTERWVRTHPFGTGDLRVLVVDVPSNEVVAEDTVDA